MAEQAHAAEEQVRKLTTVLDSVALPMVIKSALELNLFDIISAAGDGTFLSASQISAQLPTKNPAAAVMLDRLLRFLATYSILKCSLRTGDNGEVERLYGVEPTCKFLTMNQDGGSLGPFFLLLYHNVFMQSWYHLNDAILEGGIPFNMANGMSTFEYPSTDQKFNQIFNQAMSNSTTIIMNKVLDIYKGFEGVKVLVDVGGGIGVTINIITTKYPHIKGINFDLPHIVADAPSYSGVDHVSEDMFVSVPKGDAIFLKWILHDWSDEHCLKLLKNCWEALPSSGKVVVLESVLPEVPENSVSSNMVAVQDMVMLLQTSGGKERTKKEFEALSVKAGFFGCELICCANNAWVMEFYK